MLVQGAQRTGVAVHVADPAQHGGGLEPGRIGDAARVEGAQRRGPSLPGVDHQLHHRGEGVEGVVPVPVQLHEQAVQGGQVLLDAGGELRLGRHGAGGELGAQAGEISGDVGLETTHAS